MKKNTWNVRCLVVKSLRPSKPAYYIVVLACLVALEVKSINLQYDTLVCWAGLVNQASDVPSINFFHKILQNSLQKPFQFILHFFYTITKIKIKFLSAPSL